VSSLLWAHCVTVSDRSCHRLSFDRVSACVLHTPRLLDRSFSEEHHKQQLTTEGANFRYSAWMLKQELKKGDADNKETQYGAQFNFLRRCRLQKEVAEQQQLMIDLQQDRDLWLQKLQTESRKLVDTEEQFRKMQDSLHHMHDAVTASINKDRDGASSPNPEALPASSSSPTPSFTGPSDGHHHFHSDEIAGPPPAAASKRSIASVMSSHRSGSSLSAAVATKKVPSGTVDSSSRRSQVSSTGGRTTTNTHSHSDDPSSTTFSTHTSQRSMLSTSDAVDGDAEGDGGLSTGPPELIPGGQYYEEEENPENYVPYVVDGGSATCAMCDVFDACDLHHM
jgi:hypothetical protein